MGPKGRPETKTDWPSIVISTTTMTQKLKPSTWGYSWATLVLWEINTGALPSRLGESQI
jgi:hypothetical protein